MAESGFVIIEQLAPFHASEAYWTGNVLPRLSLMQCPTLAHLAQEGPWLIATERDLQETVAELEEQLGPQAVMGWLSSNLSHAILAKHLGRALVAQTTEGRRVLLRSYAPQVIPVLHARTDCQWRDYLFGPINNWWVRRGSEVKEYPGRGLSAVPEHFKPIVLDDDLLARLGSDQQALALLEELEKVAPQIFEMSCHGERLKQVERALSLGRHSGLSHAEDQLLFATLTLLEGRTPDHYDYWFEVLRMVEEESITLGHALEQVMEERSDDPVIS